MEIIFSFSIKFFENNHSNDTFSIDCLGNGGATHGARRMAGLQNGFRTRRATNVMTTGNEYHCFLFAQTHGTVHVLFVVAKHFDDHLHNIVIVVIVTIVVIVYDYNGFLGHPVKISARRALGHADISTWYAKVCALDANVARELTIGKWKVSG